MMTVFLSYPVDSDAAGREILEALHVRFRTRKELRSLPPVAWYDTFDWRLYRDGGTLWACQESVGWEIRWATLAGEVRHRLRVDALPGLARDLPDGPLREEMAAVLGPRRLLPLATMERLRQSVQILDADERVFAEVELEQAVARAPGEGGPQGTLPSTLHLLRRARGSARSTPDRVSLHETRKLWAFDLQDYRPTAEP